MTERHIVGIHHQSSSTKSLCHRLCHCRLFSLFTAFQQKDFLGFSLFNIFHQHRHDLIGSLSLFNESFLCKCRSFLCLNRDQSEFLFNRLRSNWSEDLESNLFGKMRKSQMKASVIYFISANKGNQLVSYGFLLLISTGQCE